MLTSKNPTNRLDHDPEKTFIKNINTSILCIKVFLGIIFGYCTILLSAQLINDNNHGWSPESPLDLNNNQFHSHDLMYWVPPDTNEFEHLENKKLLRYGRNLVAHTAVYLGPQGAVKKISNGLNCQNCHLNAGTKLFGNNLGAVASRYPLVQPRSGTLVTIEERVNGCLERSLNGQRLDNESVEMKAFVAYLKWLGKDIDKEKKQDGLGMKPIAFIDRPADPQKGNLVYDKHCKSCHGINGEGLMSENQQEWKYPLFMEAIATILEQAFIAFLNLPAL